MGTWVTYIVVGVQLSEHSFPSWLSRRCSCEGARSARPGWRASTPPILELIKFVCIWVGGLPLQDSMLLREVRTCTLFSVQSIHTASSAIGLWAHHSRDIFRVFMIELEIPNNIICRFILPAPPKEKSMYSSIQVQRKLFSKKEGEGSLSKNLHLSWHTHI